MDVTGIDNHELNALKMVDASAKVLSQNGFIIAIMHHYAYLGKGRTIHSSAQMEHYKNKVDDRSLKCGGRQCIYTLDGYILPLDIICGLPYLKMFPHTDDEWHTLPHVILTSGDPWDPTCIDYELSTEEDWFHTLQDLDKGLIKTPFDEFGNYRHREPTTAIPVDTPDPNVPDLELNLHEAYHILSDLNERYIPIDDEGEHICMKIDLTSPKIVKQKPIEYEKYRPYFLQVPTEKVRETFKRTTQYATNIMAGQNITQTYKSPFPAHNVWRRQEPVATDTIFAQVPAIATNGQTMAQIFVGRKSLVIDIYGMGTDKEFVNTLEDIIRKRGAMTQLISDSAAVEHSRRVLDILRALCIDDWQSEANYQHQNFAEHRWQRLKHNVNWFMNWRDIPPELWLLCSQWCADVMNHTSEKSLGWRPPLQVLTGQTVDISILLCFLFWDVVYVERYKQGDYKGMIGSTKSSEIRGRFVGFAWDVGHALTFKVLTDDTKKILCRSRVRLASDKENILTKLDEQTSSFPPRRKPDKVFIESKRDGDILPTLPTIDLSTNPFTETITIPPPTSSPSDDTSLLPDELPIPNANVNPNPPTPDSRPPPISPASDTSSAEGERSRRSAENERPTVETVLEDDDDETGNHKPREHFYHSPLDDPPLEEQPLAEEEPFIRPQSTPEQPYDFSADKMTTDNKTESAQLPPDELLQRTFLMPPNDDGSRDRAKILEIINDHKERTQKEIDQHPEMIKFKCIVGKDKREEVVAYNDIVDYIEADESWDGIWHFEEILDHKIVKPGDPDYDRSRYSVLVRWTGGETTWVGLKTIYDSDPVTLAIYARKHNLLDTPGWKYPLLKKYAKTEKRMIRRANQAKLHSFRTKPVYMYGYQVPRNHEQAMELDRQNGNTKWRDSEKEELVCIDNYHAFIDKGKDYDPGSGYKKITVHMVYCVKHDGRHRARLVAGGHLTETPIDSVYSSVVSLRGIRMLTFFAELNQCNVWATDISSAYLESKTKEKVYVIAGPEFGEREGHVLIIDKALYGLKTSGVRWHDKFADVLRGMGFFPSKGENDIWMRSAGNHYEYIGVYVDDLIIVSRDCQSIVDQLVEENNFKVKGTGEVSFHLGCDFFRDKEGVLCYAPRKYIDKMLENFQRIFGHMPRKATSPLVKGDHPELDTSDYLDEEFTKIYQSLIGALQWVIQIGRFDITTAVMTMSRFRVAPRQGHMDRIKRIYGYLLRMKHGTIRIRTGLPDYSKIPCKEYDWFYTVYCGAKEEIPDDIPPPLGKPVRTTAWVDANLLHDLISGKSVTGILHLLNQTPIDWFSKLQSTVETATFGSEYIATRTCTEQIIDLRTTLRYLGIPIYGPSIMFGDNESVVDTASIPTAKLHKRHIALSYHKTRYGMAAGITRYHHVSGTKNPADILSKHWDLNSVWPSMKPILFHEGDTAELEEIGDDKDKDA